MAQAVQNTILAYPELVGPDYNIYQYRSDFYKVVRFKSTRARVTGPYSLEGQEEVDGSQPAPAPTELAEKKRLSQSLSRSRRTILELAICNDWKWFTTLTIAEGKWNREDLATYHKKFSQWIKDQRKKHGINIRYLLIPELHSDGKSWHMHGFFGAEIDPLLQSFKDLDKSGYRGPDGKKIPRKLIQHNYFDWPDYRKKFGFCSLGEIRDQKATAFYATKYMTKCMQDDTLQAGMNLYYASRGLNRAEYFDSVYGSCPPLDSCLTHDYQFCSTGFYSFQREPGDDPMLDILEQQGEVWGPLYPVPAEPVITASPVTAPEESEALEYYDTMQSILARLRS